MDSLAPTANVDDSRPTARTLLDAVNADAASARVGSLALGALAAYLIATVASIDHKDLLLSSRILLPFMQVEIPLNGFFAVAPAILLAVHAIVLMQHVSLKQTINGLNHTLSICGGKGHALRLELDPYFFVQAYAGPQPSLVMNGFRFTIIGLMLVVFPVFTLVYFQVAYLPTHNAYVTGAHRLYIVLDLALLYLMATSILLPDKDLASTPLKRLLLTRLLTVWIYATLIGALFFSLFVATLPGGILDRNVGKLAWYVGLAHLDSISMLDNGTSHPQGKMFLRTTPRTHPVLSVTHWLFEGQPDPRSGKPSSWFSRNLSVTDTTLVFHDGTKNRGRSTSIDLRGRDLRYARLDGSDLPRAKLSGADLRYASLIETNLQHADLEIANLSYANLSQAKLQHAQFAEATLRYSLLDNSNLTNADLSRASMAGAILNRAKLVNANLSRTDLTEASLSWADLRHARLVWTFLTGANLFAADLRGAELKNVQHEQIVITDAKLPGEWEAMLTKALPPPTHELAGVWRGRAAHPHFVGKTDKTYAVKLSINEFGIGFSSYPELKCHGASSGTKRGHTYIFVEHIETGKDICRNGFVKMHASGDVLSWQWYYADGRLGAAGQLTKQ